MKITFEGLESQYSVFCGQRTALSQVVNCDTIKIEKNESEGPKRIALHLLVYGKPSAAPRE